MSKELEALDRLIAVGDPSKYWNSNYFVEDVNIVKQALQRLEAIDNAKPSEALEDLHKVASKVELADCDDYWEVRNAYARVEQSLLKAQEQEKVLSIIKEKNVDIKFLRLLINSDSEYTRKNALKIYNLCLDSVDLTQEEFDLLKRWLG